MSQLVHTVHDPFTQQQSRLTLAPSLQMLKLHPPTESRVSLKKGERSRQHTAPECSLKWYSGREAAGNKEQAVITGVVAHSEAVRFGWSHLPALQVEPSRPCALVTSPPLERAAPSASNASVRG